MLSQLLNELDGIEPLVNVTVVAATNRPDIIVSWHLYEMYKKQILTPIRTMLFYVQEESIEFSMLDHLIMIHVKRYLESS